MARDKYVAHYSANNESQTFNTFEKAEKWLKDQWDEDAGDGYSEESCSGGDYIAKITHRSEFVETQNKEKDGYKWNEEAHGYFIDGNPDEEEWTSEFDALGEIRLKEVVTANVVKESLIQPMAERIERREYEAK